MSEKNYYKNYLDHVYAVSDDSGSIVEHYRYSAFGEVEIYSPAGVKLAVSAIDNGVMWNSRRFDADTGLYYYKYRHYAAQLGRWLGRDPIGEKGGNNLYGFILNRPLNGWDELGLYGFSWTQEILPWLALIAKLKSGGYHGYTGKTPTGKPVKPNDVALPYLKRSDREVVSLTEPVKCDLY